MTATDRVTAFIKLSRPHFLLGGLVMFALGAFSQISISELNWLTYALAQFAITAAQLTAHYVNEYADYEADRAIVNRTAFSGGSGVLIEGILSRRTPLLAARVTTAITLITLMAGAITQNLNIQAALAILMALVISWAYSMPPTRLLQTGWGELATALTVAVLVPLSGAFSQSTHISQDLWWILSALVLLQLAMLLVFELPDLISDRAAGKTVLAVRIGDSATKHLTTTCICIALTMTLFESPTIALTLTPIAITLAFSMRHERYALMTFSATALFFSAGCAFTFTQLS